MPEAVIVDAVRTPDRARGQGVAEGRPRRRPRRRAAEGARRAQPGVDFSQTDDLMMGCGFQAGEQGYNVGRNAQLLAGIDHHVPATTVNRFCASSLQTLRMAFHAIKAGEGDQYIAAGVEAVSRFPRRADSVPPAARRLRGLALQRLHPDGADGGERRRALPRQPRVAGRVGGDLARTARSPPATAATSTARSSPSPRPTAPRSRATTARAPARRWRSSPSSSPPSTPRAARSRPATPARSTTAPPPCS